MTRTGAKRGAEGTQEKKGGEKKGKEILRTCVCPVGSFPALQKEARKEKKEWYSKKDETMMRGGGMGSYIL